MTKSNVLTSSGDFQQWMESLAQVRQGHTFHPVTYGDPKPDSYPCIAVAFLSEDSQSRDTADIDFVYLSDFNQCPNCGGIGWIGFSECPNCKPLNVTTTER